MNVEELNLIKVANIIEEGRLGGPQIRIARVSKELINHGIITIVFLPKSRSSNSFKNILKSQNTQYVDKKLTKLSKNKIQIIIYILTFPYEIASLGWQLKKYNIQLVHCNGAFQIKGILAAKLARIKVVWHLNDTFTPSIVKKIFSILAKKFCDNFIVAADAVKKYYLSEELGKKNIYEIQSPIDTDYFSPKKRFEIKKFSLLNPLEIIIVSNISPVKGLEYLIEAVSLANQKGMHIKLKIIGEKFDNQKQYISKIEAMVRSLNLNSIVTFMGRVSEIKPLLDTAHVYICSSTSEASPVSVWEAMSMGKAIVSTDVGDVARFLIHKESAYVCETEDAKSLLDGITYYYKKPELITLYSEKVRKTAIENFNTLQIAKQHLNCYKEILNKL